MPSSRGQMCAIYFPLLAIKSCMFFKVAIKFPVKPNAPPPSPSHLVTPWFVLTPGGAIHSASAKPWKSFYINHLLCNSSQHMSQSCFGSSLESMLPPLNKPALKHWGAIINSCLYSYYEVTCCDCTQKQKKSFNLWP